MLLKQPLDVTPEIYFADGAEYDLPTVHLEPAGVSSVDIRAAIEDSDVPPKIRSHISAYGMVGISYHWSWSAVMASIQNTDEILSLSAASSPLARKSLVHQSPEAVEAHIIRSSWWRPTKDSDEVIAVGNTSLTAKQVQIRVSDASGNLIAKKEIALRGQHTTLVHVNDFLSGNTDPGVVGDVTMSYSGALHGIVASASIEDTVTGFSMTPSMAEQTASAKEAMQAVTLHAPGLMLGRQDPSMMFPPEMVFTPYAILHNVSDHNIEAVLSLTSDGTGGNPSTRALDTIPIASGATLKIDMSRYFNTAAPLPDGFGHLSVSYTGHLGDLLFDVGSTDETNNYVFPVVPSVEAPSTSKIFCFWSLQGDTSTMISVWNYGDKAQDATLALYYSGGQYRIPVHLGPRHTYNLDLMTLVRNRVPDADGAVLPGDDPDLSGSATLVGPKGELDKITVVASASTYNVRSATCWPVCLNCGGLTSLYLDPDTMIVPAKGWGQATAKYTTSSGGPYVMTGGNWSSSPTSIATVNSSGSVYGQAPGSANLLALMSAPLGGTNCYFSAQTICQDQAFEGPGTANVGDQTPVITGISPSVWDAGTTTTVTFTGQYFGTNAPTLNFSPGYGITYTLSSYNDNQIVANITVRPGIPTENVNVTVTNNGYGGFGFASGSGNSPTSGPAAAQVYNPLTIVAPSQNQSFTLADSNYTQTVPISYSVSGGSGGQTNWSVSLTYQTTGGYPNASDTVTSGFSTTGASSYTTQYTSVGGQLTVVASQGSQSPSVTACIAGVQIPASTLINQLVSLYGSSQPTPHLMTGIASVESSIQQFKSTSLYGQTLYWPYASYDGGSHVGLMQMPTSMDYAFNWQDNASNAVALFNSKKTIATNVAAGEISAYTGLPALSGLQLENMALTLYGPYAGGTRPALQYYVPSCVGGTVSGSGCVNGSWQWIVNTAGNANGVAYANTVRSQIQ